LQTDMHLYYPNALQPDKWPRESAGKMARVSEIFRYWVDIEDCENPDLTAVPYVGTWNRITPWLPWMFMGGRPGHLRYRGKKTKLADVSELNEPLRGYVAKHPRFHSAPDEWSEPNESSFESYARQHKPRA